ncbi:MAG: hypothetical protein M0Z87_06575, partial [Actinomycetota bacterium]|nr:hypothetical protein [Actinomycetota bacterium]
MMVTCWPAPADEGDSDVIVGAPLVGVVVEPFVTDMLAELDVWPEALVTVTVAVVPGVTVHWVLLVPEPVGTVKVTDVFDHEL